MRKEQCFRGECIIVSPAIKYKLEDVIYLEYSQIILYFASSFRFASFYLKE